MTARRPSRAQVPRDARVMGATARLTEPGIDGARGDTSRLNRGYRWRCQTCGLEVTTWAACEGQC